MELFDSLPQPPRAPRLQMAIDEMSKTDETQRGAVYTRREVVEAILDLVGYTADRPLHLMQLLEPSFGGGDFLLPALDRLLAAYRRAGGEPAHARQELGDAVVGVELSLASVGSTRVTILERLVAEGLTTEDALGLATTWLLQDDFLLASLPQSFDFIVGNPPYVRQERIPGPLLKEYRQRFKTVYDRADLYIPFFERSLRLLKQDARLGFICSDRWLKNKYGGPLREFVDGAFHLRYFIDMVTVDAFTSDVVAYPAITVIEKGQGETTRIARRPALAELPKIARAMKNGGPSSHPGVEEATHITNGRDPWLLDSSEELSLLRSLEDRLPTLEETGCRVGIGVATGADRILTGPYDELPVEPSRKLKMAAPRDLSGGQVNWRGLGVINPFEDDGTLAKLDDYPLFSAFLTQHEERLRARHVAKKSPNRWYRTIDRIHNSLVETPKLLIPDIKGGTQVSFDEGRYYPHHNLYYIVSEDWNLRALQAVLRSSLALFFVNAYCIKMSGGFLRFQAQYLRRIRLPSWTTLNAELKAKLIEVACSQEQDMLDAVVFDAYSLSSSDRKQVATAAAKARRKS